MLRRAAVAAAAMLEQAAVQCASGRGASQLYTQASSPVHTVLRSALQQAHPHLPQHLATSSVGILRAMHVKAGKRKASAAELGMYGAAAVVAMIGGAYGMVPVYRAFCAATGYGGFGVDPLGQTIEEKMRRREENPNEKVEEAAANREVIVWFDAAVADDMPWRFKPTQEYVKVKPGQSTLAFFTAENLSDHAITGYSLYNVAPIKAANYFNKIQCFCFEEQRLRPKEKVDMPVFFYVDPEFATDWNCRNVDDITLSYVFHKVEIDDDEDVDDDAPTLIKVHSNPEHAEKLAALATPSPVGAIPTPTPAVPAAPAADAAKQ